MRVSVILAIVSLTALIFLLMWSQQPAPQRPAAGEVSKLELRSVFGYGERIPVKYTCDGEDVSPPLEWEPLKGVKSYALIVEDPDAPMGTFTHWVLYDIPGDVRSLPEGVPKEGETRYGKQGLNDFGRIGYGGPCPPPGKPHRYFFKLYALDTVLNLKPGLKRGEVLAAIKGHVIAQAELMGTYGRG